MSLIADRVNKFEESETLAMAKLARELKQQGKDIINLSTGEPDFDTPNHIREAAKKAIDEGHTHYPPVTGYPELKNTICAKFESGNNLKFSSNQIVVSTGAKQSIMNTLLATINPGDEVLLPAPYWVSYPQMVKMVDGIPVILDTQIQDDFKITPPQLEESITEKTKMLILTSPCNPTGTVYSFEELNNIAIVLKNYPDILIISDEIYEHINFNGQHNSIAQFEEIKDQIIVVNGVSKGFAMTGWRIGYIAAQDTIAKACEKIQGQFTSGASSISQYAALSALSSGLDETRKMCDEFKSRRDLLLNLMEEVPGVKTNVPDGAFYLFPDISEYIGKCDGENVINSSKELCMYLLNQHGLALVPGESFGNGNCIRISYAASTEVIEKAITRLKSGLEKLT
ncbi:MAG: pyridoxal phosphate-dependent aminotransferase [Bacteroidia bacterium]|nr:pyridoxal phosphate-dependent aminotransferase [Bacteroidia bacterium]